MAGAASGYPLTVAGAVPTLTAKICRIGFPFDPNGEPSQGTIEYHINGIVVSGMDDNLGIGWAVNYY